MMDLTNLLGAIALLAGNNTIWTDGDEVTLTYKAKRG